MYKKHEHINCRKHTAYIKYCYHCYHYFNMWYISNILPQERYSLHMYSKVFCSSAFLKDKSLPDCLGRPAWVSDTLCFDMTFAPPSGCTCTRSLKVSWVQHYNWYTGNNRTCICSTSYFNINAIILISTSRYPW